jgi:hypothetical protein
VVYLMRATPTGNWYAAVVSPGVFSLVLDQHLLNGVDRVGDTVAVLPV